MNDGDIIFMPSILLHIVATAIAFIPFPQGSRHSSRAVRGRKKEEEPPGASGSHSSFFLYSVLIIHLATKTVGLYYYFYTGQNNFKTKLSNIQ